MGEVERRREALEAFCDKHRCGTCPLNVINGISVWGPCVLRMAVCGLDVDAEVEDAS